MGSAHLCTILGGFLALTHNLPLAEVAFLSFYSFLMCRLASNKLQSNQSYTSNLSQKNLVRVIQDEDTFWGCQGGIAKPKVLLC